MNYKESWNYLVDAHKKGKFKEEAQIQSDWENYFAESELFGYSRIKNDIISQPRLVLGSTEREIPDILLCRNGEKLFVAELKRYSLQKNEKFEKQLLNYLTHTDIHLSVGILICEKIYIYCYDFSANKHISLEIPFEKDNSDGIQFVELFSKQNFDEKKIQDFVASRKLASQNIAKIKESINESLVKNLLKEHFSKNFAEDDFEKAIEGFEFLIKEKGYTDSPATVPQRAHKSPVDPPIIPIPLEYGKTTVSIKGTTIPMYRSENLSVQDFVKQTLNTLFAKNLLPSEEITRLQDEEYCKKTFSLQFSLLQKDWNKCVFVTKDTGKVHIRYWSNFKAGGFYVCSQWWKAHFSEYDRKIASWLVYLEKTSNL